MVDRPLNILDACAGYGMLGEAVRFGLDALGIAGRVVAHVERDAAAAAALVARMEAAAVGCAPLWDDLATFDGRRWRGCVDIACAGLPCQPYSLAGKRTGNADHRSHGDDGAGPVPHFLRIVGECGPAVVFLENVPAWVMGGHFRSVGEELSRMGYTIEEPLFIGACDVGAPHERERVFVLAVADADLGRRGIDFAGRGPDRRGAACRAGAGVADASCWGVRIGQRVGAEIGARAESGIEGHREGLADSASRGLGISGQPSERDGLVDGRDAERAESRAGITRVEGHPELGRDRLADAGDQMGFAESARHARHAVGGGDGIGRWAILPCERRAELPLFPPGRGDESDPDHHDWWAWAAVAAVDTAHMPRVEPELSMVAPRLAFSRADLLRIGGNGVSPVVGAVAFAHLLARAVARIRGEAVAA